MPLEWNATLRKKRRADIANPEIIIRNPRHCRDISIARHWLGGDPVATAWFTALSASFPHGEDYFIAALRANLVPLPAPLAKDVAAFIAQESNHAREHELFNRLAEQSGHDLRAINARLEDFIAQTASAPNFVKLAVTAALEHFTAIIAHDVLAHDPFAATDPQIAALWRWHAVEEIEHKAVGFDVWMHVARRLSRWRRWKIRCLIMLKITVLFVSQRCQDARELLVQDGLSPREARRALRRYLWGSGLWGRGGVLRRMAPAWARWFRPGFHPWQRDDSTLIAREAARTEA